MNILLINPPRAAGEPVIFPLGLAYVAAVLRQSGCAVDVLDLNVTGSDIRVELVAKLAEQAYSYFGITGMIINFKAVQKISAVLKCQCPQVPIILGGGLASAIPREVFSNTDVDICVLGEGEMTIVELLTALSRKEDLARIQGICFKDGNGLTFNQARKEVAPIDELPFPAWDLFSIDSYLSSGDRSGPHMDIITSRGCPYQCTFCFKGIFGNKFRGRTAENIVQEILMLKKRYNIRSFTIRDDTFVIDKKRVIEFCNLLLINRVRLRWSCNGHINLMDMEMLKVMKRAGCVGISYGIESGNPKILCEIKKNLSLNDAEKVIKTTRKAGIIPLGYFIVGMPGDTRKTIKDSIEFCKNSGIVPHFNFAGPIPGTELYDYAVKKGYIVNELEYLMRTDWKSISINMTSLSDNELSALGGAASAEIMRHNLFHYPGQSLLMAWQCLRNEGIAKFTYKFILWLASSSWSPLTRNN